METIEAVEISLGAGLHGDHKGLKFKNRAVTILSLEAWRETLDALAEQTGNQAALNFDWTVRRANLLVEGLDLPKARGGRLRIGSVDLEFTYPTQPCKRMDEAAPGLLKAMHPDWRGGVTARVICGGRICLGDEVVVTNRPPDVKRRLA